MSIIGGIAIAEALAQAAPIVAEGAIKLADMIRAGTATAGDYANLQTAEELLASSLSDAASAQPPRSPTP